mmetsp:Transcript_41258/g.106730  ORF Transcript_41258/g.106730 Transcript_41258/m.106730 type:complete len:256 (+) Transcript_41258:1216-1983(+)
MRVDFVLFCHHRFLQLYPMCSDVIKGECALAYPCLHLLSHTIQAVEHHAKRAPLRRPVTPHPLSLHLAFAVLQKQGVDGAVYASAIAVDDVRRGEVLVHTQPLQCVDYRIRACIRVVGILLLLLRHHIAKKGVAEVEEAVAVRHALFEVGQPVWQRRPFQHAVDPRQQQQLRPALILHIPLSLIHALIFCKLQPAHRVHVILLPARHYLLQRHRAGREEDAQLRLHPGQLVEVLVPLPQHGHLLFQYFQPGHSFG